MQYYREIKLISYSMKFWERVIEQPVRREISVSINQFSFMPGSFTIEAIYILIQLTKKYKDRKKDLHMIFIDLEKVYDRVLREIFWWVLE